MFTDNKDFYPTPKRLIKKMISRVKDFSSCRTILEPSAGSGAIIDYINEEYKWGSHQNIMAIEVDPNLRAILKSKKTRIIDSDFLLYNGIEKFDLIIANFPFSDGDKHLLKAIDVLYSGQIVCLVNAETIRNPHSNSRKDLISKLNKLNAKIEYIKDAFMESDRKTGVEVALIHIEKTVDAETDLFAGMEDKYAHFNEKLSEDYGLAERDGITNIVREYNRDKEILTSQIVEFYKNYKYVSSYLDLVIEGSEERISSDATLTQIMQSKVNGVAVRLKKDYWQKSMNLDEVKKRLTSSKKRELLMELDNYSQMEFTEANIRQFVTNLIGKFPKMIEESIVHIFDKFTSYALMDSRWGDDYRGNIHLFNAWKSNSGFKINKKVILPMRLDSNYNGTYKISYTEQDIMADIDRVISYFSPTVVIKPMYETCEKAINAGQTRKIETDYFYVSVFKKGTIHIEFKNEETLRLFNIEACKLKNFLPMDYSEKEFSDLSKEEAELVNSFESKKEYKVVDKKDSAISRLSLGNNLLIGFNK